jgi:hypothetical protein
VRKAPSRAASRKTSPAEPAVVTTTTVVTTKTKKRKQAPVEVQEEEAEMGRESPMKKARTLKDGLFRERVAERQAAKARQQSEQSGESDSSQDPAPVVANPPQYTPGAKGTFAWYKPPTWVAVPPAWTAAPPATPARTSSQPQQVAQTQPASTRGFINRFIETITPFKRRSQTPSSVDMRLPDARIELIQLQEHTKLQHKLNEDLQQAILTEEQRNADAASQREYEEYEVRKPMTDSDRKRKRTANEITGLPPLNVISESPETRFKDNLRTPSRASTMYKDGLVVRSVPKPRRTYKEARAAAVHRATRNAADPPTPAINRTAPSTPYRVTVDERIRISREIEGLKVQQQAMQEKLKKLRDEAEAEVQPRKTKRVKVEHLKEIPHNLPGEPSGSFRFPDFDSDDEIEVDEDAELIENAFAEADDEETPEPSQASPTKAPTSNVFPSQPFPVTVETSALQTASPFKKAVSPVKKATSPVTKTPLSMKQAPSPVKKVLSPVKEVPHAFEAEEDEVDAGDASPTASPETTQIFSDASADESDIDDEEWPELPQGKGSDVGISWWSNEAVWKGEAMAQALAIFNKDFAHWEATGEVVV